MSSPVTNKPSWREFRNVPHPAASSNSKNLLGFIALLPLLVWFVLNWFQTIRAIVRDYNPLPVWDYWRVIQNYDRYKAFDFSVLWVQHNAHRIVFPELVFAADALLFHANQVFTLTASFICYSTVLITVAFALRSDKSMSPSIRSAAVLLSGIIIGWQGCVIVLGDSFLLNWTMVQGAVCLGLLLLANTRERERAIYLAGAILLGVIATFSSGNGMLFWPIAIFFAFVLHLRRSQMVVLWIAAVASIALYFTGYKSSGDLNLHAIVQHPMYFVGFVASFMSMPLGVLHDPRFGVIVGCLNLAVFSGAFYTITRKGLLGSKAAVVLLGSYLFTLASAVLTSAGRMNPADANFIAAKAARYVSLPLANWGILILIILWLSSRRKWEVFSPGNLVIIFSLILLALLPKLHPWMEGNNAFVANQQIGTLSMESGLLNPDLAAKLYPDPGFIVRERPVMQRNHLALYRENAPVTWIGMPAQSEFPGSRRAQPSLETPKVIPILGGLEVVGHGPNVTRGRRIVFVNQAGIIVGFGENPPAGTPTAFGPVDDRKVGEWIGFINLGFSANGVSGYLADGRDLTRITGDIAVPPFTETTAADLGAPLPNITWQVSNWAKDALPPAVDVHVNSPKTFWSSFVGSEASVGRITSSAVGAPPNHCIVLPVVHGPSAGGLSVQILDPQSHQLIADILMQDGDTQWKLWRVPLKENTAAVQIVGEDKGAGWGQWLAVGDPVACRN